MSNCITLKAAIEGVLSCQRENGHPESYLIDLRRTYNRLLKHAEKLGTEYLTNELEEIFLSDSISPKSGEYRHERFLAHNRCIRFLESFLETGEVSVHKNIMRQSRKQFPWAWQKPLGFMIKRKRRLA